MENAMLHDFAAGGRRSSEAGALGICNHFGTHLIGVPRGEHMCARFRGRHCRSFELQRTSRANADDRLPCAAFGRVEGGDRVVQG